MRLFATTLATMAAGNQMMNYLIADRLGDGSSDIMKVMLMSPGLMGQNQMQADQMSQILPYMLMKDSSSSNAKKMMMLMMQNPQVDMNQMMPLLMADDDVDMKTLFLTTTMMQSNCAPTNDQFNQLLLELNNIGVSPSSVDQFECMPPRSHTKLKKTFSMIDLSSIGNT